MSEDLSGRRISGAPRMKLPWFSKKAPLHFLAEEKGTVSSQVQPGGEEKLLRTASMVGLLSGSAVVSAHRAVSAISRSVLSQRIRSSNCKVPSVIVPVLSRHKTSTRASVSMQYSS